MILEEKEYSNVANEKKKGTHSSRIKEKEHIS